MHLAEHGKFALDEKVTLTRLAVAAFLSGSSLPVKDRERLLARVAEFDTQPHPDM